MSDWRSHIQKFHDLDHADAPGSLVLGQPASAQAILDLETALGCKFPADFHSFYQTFDGFGTAGEDGPDWFFLPLASIQEHTEGVRSWFEKTHPDLAASFIAFADWGNGDATGYLTDSTGIVIPGVHIFEHESYHFEPTQDPDDFLFLVDENLEDFLIS